ncbi:MULTISPECIES: hypothetical protein [unclassified Paraburkholderia]|uniref:hypothetical protein n=1 Tax=unclassified Paraburkholderia TaxID=2615204 RepID=UPI0016212939|nr:MULTISPECIES: hypothetical protein [unclassified Paraburkholderia]MBB5409841.1 hypothetical protein [Paraburkholderia sp. HC6.4b]MBB5451816.1 hypothetical protein [Paraburkholderia sp. Kb1A]
MKTLMIKDLSVTEQLDSKAMQAVRGGFGPSKYYSFAPVYAPTSVKNTTTTQLISNELNFQNTNGNDVALATGITSDFSPYINSSNSNH